MISWSNINELQKQKLELQLKLNELLNSKDVSKDKINELRAEIKHLDKDITKILGSNEVERIEELKKKKDGTTTRNIKNFYALKDKYKKISKMKLAITKMLALIEIYNKKSLYEGQIQKVR